MEQEQIKSMEILILTNVWTGASPFFYEGKTESKGMPAFNNVFLKLLNDERVKKVHIMVWEPNAPLEMPAVFAEKIIYYPINTNLSFLKGLFLTIKCLLKGVSIIRHHQGIKTIIGYGGLAGITAIIGRIVGIADFRRIFGTFLISEIKSAKWRLLYKHPLEYMAFALKGKGLLITNDGTKGDVVFDKIGSPKLPLHFLLNGVDKKITQNAIKPKFEFQENCLSYVARLDPWKRQHLFIKAIALLKKENVQFPFSYIVGSEHDKNYVQELKQLIINEGLEDKVLIINGLAIREVHYVLMHSTITFSLYDVSNLGNVFIEALQLGTPTIAINDSGSLDLIAREAFYELKTAEITLIAAAIKDLLSDSEARAQLREGARNFANNRFLSWDERATIEVNLMLE